MPSKRVLKNFKREQHLFKKRLLTLWLLGFLIIMILMARLYQLQISQHQHYKSLATKNSINEAPIAPSRGMIYDRQHRIIAGHMLTYQLWVRPKDTGDLAQTLAKLQKWAHITPTQRQRFDKIRSHYRAFQAVPLKTNLSKSEVDTLYAHHFELPGIEVQTTMRRIYPYGAALTPVLGYVAKRNAHEQNTTHDEDYRASPFIGKRGIEHFYENILHGKPGEQAFEVNVTGWPQKDVFRTQPIAGHAITLTIDAEFQKKIYALLANQNAAVVAIDPQNGDVLGLVSHPSFDSNLFAQGMQPKTYQAWLKDKNLPLFNRAINGQFPPASTLKPFIALAALDAGIIDAHTSIEDHGVFQLPHTQHVYRDWLPSGHGTVNLKKAIIVSCDTFFYDLAVKTGMHRIVPLLRQFGFGQPMHIDVHASHHGVLSDPQWKMAHQGVPWYTGDTIISFIGQGNMLTTPLQLAQATSLLAMRGHGFEPHLLQSIETYDHHTWTISPQPHPPILLKPGTWQQVIDAMHGVIFSHMPMATGWRFGRPSYQAAGKTGTAQIVHDERKRRQANIKKALRDHSWFIGFAPIKKPKIAVAVICEHSSDAAHIARQVMDLYLLPKTKKTIH